MYVAVVYYCFFFASNLHSTYVSVFAVLLAKCLVLNATTLDV